MSWSVGADLSTRYTLPSAVEDDDRLFLPRHRSISGSKYRHPCVDAERCHCVQIRSVPSDVGVNVADDWAEEGGGNLGGRFPGLI